MPLPPLKKPPGPLATIRAVGILVLGLTALLLINLVQLLSLVFLPFSRTVFRRINRWCANSWWGWCVSWSEWAYGVEIIMTGDDAPMRENVLLVANHQQMPDIPAIMKFARTRDRLGDLKFFVKKQLKWVPGMGWGMQFLDCLYVDRDWSSDRDTIRCTFSRLVDDKVPVYLVSFVEGTRLTFAKLEAAREYAQANGLRIPRHTLVPRTKGFAASVEGLRDHATAVYDLTIGYENGVPSLWQYLLGLVKRIHLHVRRFPIEDLPEADSDLRTWLLDRFEEKDALLDYFYENGTFPPDALSDTSN